MKKILLLLPLVVATWVVCFWQLEMVWVGYATGWGYRFAWFPHIEHQNVWLWRDVWWVVENVLFFSLVIYILKRRG